MSHVLEKMLTLVPTWAVLSIVLYLYCIGKVIPKASLCIWGEVYDHSKYDITMQLYCTKLNKKGMFNKVIV